MIKLCILLSCIVSSSPLPSPTEAARILSSNQTISYNPAYKIIDDSKRTTVLNSSSTAGPYGEFKPFPPSRRLDGTLMSQPPDWQVINYWVPVYPTLYPIYQPNTVIRMVPIR